MIALALLLLSPVQVGSKQFTESVILGEIAAQLLQAQGIAAEHKRELGGTRVLWDALLHGQIDAYAEYTGTLSQELLRGVTGEAALREGLRARGVELGGPLGFSDSYAVGMKRETAARLGLRKTSDLAAHPELRLAFSNEFMDRPDGWPGLRDRYGLGLLRVRGLDHDLATRALANGSIDATDLYTTDAEIRAYDLVVLEDDRHQFPEYQAVLLTRTGLAENARRALGTLEGKIDAQAMIGMNARAKLDHIPEAQVARDFLARALQLKSDAPTESALQLIWRRTLEHLYLVVVSLCCAVLVAVPLGILAARRRRLGQVILAATGILQTIPSLALLVLLIPLLGIGAGPALIALFLYSLLPIVRNTHAGLTGLALPLRESAEALGLPWRARLRLIELPLASPSILAGIKTSAVINVGTATLGALIGAGGYGQPILTGIRLASTSLILEGALPAAALALLVQALFELLERTVVPRGLRLLPESEREG